MSSIARREPALPQALNAMPTSWADVERLGTVLAQSGFFNDSKQAAQAITKVMAGLELGIPPIAAMTGIHIVKGKVTLGAHLIASQIRRSPRYDYRFAAPLTNEACELEFLDLQGAEPVVIGTSRFTIEDAKKASLVRPDSPWLGHARNMLFARAMSNGAKWFTPDVFAGPVYTPDEMGASVDYATGEVIELPAEPLPPAGGDSPPAPAPASSGADTPAPPASGTQGSAGEPGQVLPAEPLDPGVQAWRRLFRDNDCPKPTPVERDRVRDAARAFGIEGNDDLGKLCDERTFAHVWLAARAQLGRSVGAYDRTPGQVSFTTPVPSRSAGSYQVTLWAGDRRDECTCEAGRHKRECRHLAVAMDYLRVYVEGDAYARRDFAVRLGLTEPADANEAAADRAWDAAGAAAELEGLAGDG